MSPEEYLQERLDDQINWYDKKSAWNQKWFKVLWTIEILFAVAIPFLISQITEKKRAAHSITWRVQWVLPSR